MPKIIPLGAGNNPVQLKGHPRHRALRGAHRLRLMMKRCSHHANHARDGTRPRDLPPTTPHHGKITLQNRPHQRRTHAPPLYPKSPLSPSRVVIMAAEPIHLASHHYRYPPAALPRELLRLRSPLSIFLHETRVEAMAEPRASLRYRTDVHPLQQDSLADD